MIAVLPLLVVRLSFQDGCFHGLILCIGFWLTLLFFRWSRPLFPKPLLSWALIAWYLALALIGAYRWEFRPFWVVSLALLTYQEVTRGDSDNREFFRIDLWTGLYAGTVIAFISAFREVAGFQWALGLFGHPAGIFLMLACAVLLWETQVSREET